MTILHSQPPDRRQSNCNIGKNACATLCYFEGRVCRNIRNLFNFDPPVTEQEIHAASLQFVRKISGFTKPSKANEAAFAKAVDEVAAVSARFLGSIETTAPPKNREQEAAKAKARAAERYVKIGNNRDRAAG